MKVSPPGRECLRNKDPTVSKVLVYCNSIEFWFGKCMEWNFPGICPDISFLWLPAPTCLCYSEVRVPASVYSEASRWRKEM